jgi:hypothetical protein
MRQTAIAAMLSAVIVSKKQTTAARSLKSRMDAFAKRAMEWDEAMWVSVLPPDRACFTWPVNEECGSQIWDWVDQCDREWTDMCDTVAEKWYYESNIEFKDPTRPDERCATNYDDIEDDCWEQWDLLWDQCHQEVDDAAYMWTSDCDAIEAFGDAWASWFADEDWLLNMKKAYQKMQPRI